MEAAIPRTPGGWRDPWLVAALLAPLVLLAFLAGQPLGEPVADDYDYLHHVLLSGSWSWFDGCGSSLYWRPLARQAWYAALAPAMLHQPVAVALVQVGCLCLAAALLYRAFRPALGPVAAFAVSTAPWMMESSRLLIAWPTCFQDLGALLFVSLALHEAVAGRRRSFLAAGLAALLCKEVAAVALASIVFCPAVRWGDAMRRRGFAAATGLLILGWAAVYGWVHAHAALLVPGGAPGSALDWTRAIAQVPWWSFKALWSRPPASGPDDILLVLGVLALVPWSRVRAAFDEHGAELRAWWVWGALWSAPLLLTLLPFHPGWAPYRIAFVGFGLLVATVATLRRLHPRAVPLFVLLRLSLLAIAPAPMRGVSMEPPRRGASIDVPQLSRLQHFVRDVRRELSAHHPTLAPGMAVVWENFPAMTEYGFGARPALQVWYRDTTLRWLPIRQWMLEPDRPTATIVEYQPDHAPPIARIEPDAMRALLDATAALAAGRDAEALHALARAESLQRDTSAVVFRHSIAGKRAYATARMRLAEGRYEEARAALRAVLALFPGDVPSRRLLATIDERDAGSGRTP